MQKLISNSPIPLYYQLREIIRDRILAEEWEYGAEIPSELRLCEEFNLCRATVKQALDGLVNEGLIVRQKGRGTFVVYRKLAGNFLLEPRFCQEHASSGAENDSQVIFADFAPPTPFLSKCLCLPGEGPVCKISRRHFSDKKPVALDTNYIHPDWAGDILLQDLSEVAVYKYIENNTGQSFSDYKMNVQSVLLDDYEREHLDFPPGNTGLMVQCTSFIGTTPVMFNTRIYRGDKCDLLLEFAVSDTSRKLEATSAQVSLGRKTVQRR